MHTDTDRQTVEQWDPNQPVSTCGDLRCSFCDQEIGIHDDVQPCAGAEVVA